MIQLLAIPRIRNFHMNIDRIAPTRRPPGPAAGYQDWRALLFLHWPVPVDALRPVVPSGLTLDLYEGTAYVGLVPFVVQAARPFGMPPAVGLRFLETNVRTYVHLNGREPGVYFFSLDAASLMAVIGARTVYGLPYFPARMGMASDDGVVSYSMERLVGFRPRMRLRYELGESLGPSDPGTLEHFLVERYLLHLERAGTLWTAPVHHMPYPLQRARVLEIEDELIAAAGLPEPSVPPPLVHYAAGVDVEIFAPRVRFRRRSG